MSTTYAEKLALAASLRAGTALETGIKPFAHAHPRQWRESAYLPGQSKEERAQRHREKLRKDNAA